MSCMYRSDVEDPLLEFSASASVSRLYTSQSRSKLVHMRVEIVLGALQGQRAEQSAGDALMVSGSILHACATVIRFRRQGGVTTIGRLQLSAAVHSRFSNGDLYTCRGSRSTLAQPLSGCRINLGHILGSCSFQSSDHAGHRAPQLALAFFASQRLDFTA